MIYGEQTWALQTKEREKLERTEMKMLRWILGTKPIDLVRDKENLMREMRLK